MKTRFKFLAVLSAFVLAVGLSLAGCAALSSATPHHAQTRAAVAADYQPGGAFAGETPQAGDAVEIPGTTAEPSTAEKVLGVLRVAKPPADAAAPLLGPWGIVLSGALGLATAGASAFAAAQQKGRVRAEAVVRAVHDNPNTPPIAAQVPGALLNDALAIVSGKGAAIG